MAVGERFPALGRGMPWGNGSRSIDPSGGKDRGTLTRTCRRKGARSSAKSKGRVVGAREVASGEEGTAPAPGFEVRR